MTASNSRVCMTAISLLSLPLLAAALIGLRHGAPDGLRWPARWPDCCRRDWPRRCTPRTAPTIPRCSWRPGTLITTALVTAIGALAGSRMLRI